MTISHVSFSKVFRMLFIPLSIPLFINKSTLKSSMKSAINRQLFGYHFPRKNSSALSAIAITHLYQDQTNYLGVILSLFSNKINVFATSSKLLILVSILDTSQIASSAYLQLLSLNPISNHTIIPSPFDPLSFSTYQTSLLKNSLVKGFNSMSQQMTSSI